MISMTLSRIRREVRIRLRSEKAARPGERGLNPQPREVGTYSILSVGKVEGKGYIHLSRSGLLLKGPDKLEFPSGFVWPRDPFILFPFFFLHIQSSDSVRHKMFLTASAPWLSWPLDMSSLLSP